MKISEICHVICTGKVKNSRKGNAEDFMSDLRIRFCKKRLVERVLNAGFLTGIECYDI